MKPKIAIVLLIILFIAIAGCVSSRQDQPTPAPSSSATPHSKPVLDFRMGTQYSSQLMVWFFGYAPSPGGRPVNYTVVLNNTGNTEVGNVFLIIDEVYNTTGQDPYGAEYYYDEPIRGHGNATYRLQGGPHSPNETTIIFHLCIYWGEHEEFYNTYSLPIDLLPPPGLIK